MKSIRELGYIFVVMGLFLVLGSILDPRLRSAILSLLQNYPGWTWGGIFLFIGLVLVLIANIQWGNLLKDPRANRKMMARPNSRYIFIGEPVSRSGQPRR